MVRCRCGVITNFGITCMRCSLEDWSSKFSFGEDEDIISLDDVIELEKAAEDEEED